MVYTLHSLSFVNPYTNNKKLSYDGFTNGQIILSGPLDFISVGLCD